MWVQGCDDGVELSQIERLRLRTGKNPSFWYGSMLVVEGPTIPKRPEQKYYFFLFTGCTAITIQLYCNYSTAYPVPPCDPLRDVPLRHLLRH